MVCSVAECARESSRRGMCEMHYRRFRRRGSAEPLEPVGVEHGDGTQTCSRCRERKPVGLFDADPRLSRGRRACCQSCRAANRRGRYAVDPERVLAVTQAWREANPERARQYAATAYERHKDQYLAWSRESVHQRRAILRGVERDKGVTLRALRLRDGDRCLYCQCEMTFASDGRKYVPTKATLEHVIPLAQGGGHTWANTALACWRCNITKNARTPEQWQG